MSTFPSTTNQLFTYTTKEEVRCKLNIKCTDNFSLAPLGRVLLAHSLTRTSWSLWQPWRHRVSLKSRLLGRQEVGIRER